MRKYLLLVLLILLPKCLLAQGIFDRVPDDSTTIRFVQDTLSGYLPDTARVPLWQIGKTFKSFFTSDTLGAISIMTDTINMYPINADNSFIIRIPNTFNIIVDFWHRYQTDSAHDGGFVEFSLDRMATWNNVKGDCNGDRSLSRNVTLTSGFYDANDTIGNGTPCFTGQSSGTVYSRLQFFWGLPVKTTAASTCDFNTRDSLFLRFHFTSDSLVDSLAGWMIDSIKIEQDNWCCGAVNSLLLPKSGLTVFPNPSDNGTFHFPTLPGEADYTLQVYNGLGTLVTQQPYTEQLYLPKGNYFYIVSNGQERYTGKIQSE
ncbi:MAG: T9SS C-terminal target domain-containing protein [Chitinophagia bacterium]|nr:T9SS C-terminal target domain-containing protein [Chitinophagia bacterium]